MQRLAWLASVPASFVPDPSPEFGASPTPFIVLMILGFVVGIGGHLTRSKTAVALGILMIFLAPFVLPLAVNISKSQ